MKMSLFITAVAIELLGIAAVGTGLGYEIGHGAEVGYVMITGGGVLVAAGGVLFGKFIRAKR